MPFPSYGTGRLIIGIPEFLAHYLTGLTLDNMPNTTAQTSGNGGALLYAILPTGQANDNSPEQTYVGELVWESGYVHCYALAGITVVGIGSQPDSVLLPPNGAAYETSSSEFGALALQPYGSVVSTGTGGGPQTLEITPPTQVDVGNNDLDAYFAIPGNPTKYDIPMLYVLTVELPAPVKSVAYVSAEVVVALVPWYPRDDTLGPAAAWTQAGLPDYLLAGGPPPSGGPTAPYMPIAPTIW